MKKLILLLFIPLVFGCSSDSSEDYHTDPCPDEPQLTTYEISDISIDENTDFVSATFEGKILNIELGANCETFSITNQGFVYSTNVQPTTSDNVVNASGENASANVSDLIPETTYYVKAYLTNTLGTFYGNEVNFTTPENLICIELRIGEYYADDGSNIIIFPNEINGRFDWGQEEEGEIVMYGFVTQNDCELYFTDTWGNWTLTLTDEGDILSEDGNKIYYYID